MEVLYFVLFVTGPIAVCMFGAVAVHYVYHRLMKGRDRARFLRDVRVTGITAIGSSLVFVVALAILVIPNMLPHAPAPHIRFIEFPLPARSTPADQIALGRDGALWFTEPDAAMIGRISISGQIKEFALASATCTPWSIAAGPDGALWFTEATANQIGRITTAGQIAEYPIPSANGSPDGITAGPASTLWFTQSAVTQVAQLRVAGG